MMQYMISSENAMAVVDTMGGEMVSYQREGTEYCWGGHPDYWKGRAPVLFPVVCALKNGSVNISGKPYRMDKHGFAMRREFKAVAVNEGSIELTQRFDETTLEHYPFQYGLMTVHSLLPEGFSTSYIVKNQGTEPMVFCIGGHPGFRVPMNSGESFEDYSLVFEQTENTRSLLVNGAGLLTGERGAKGALDHTDTLPLRYSDFDDDALIYDSLRSRSLRLVHKDTGKGLEFSFKGLPVLGVWTPPGKRAPFLCLEPWSGLPASVDESGNFEDKPHAVTLQPGEIHKVEYQVRIL